MEQLFDSTSPPSSIKLESLTYTVWLQYANTPDLGQITISPLKPQAQNLRMGKYFLTSHQIINKKQLLFYFMHTALFTAKAFKW